jgi:hypothetical protein
VRDQDVLQVVSDGLSGLDLDTPPEEIIAAGNSRRRRRLAALTGAGVVALAAGLAVALPTLGGSGPAGPSTAARPGSAAPVELAAFSVVSNSNGTVTLTLSRKQFADPDAVREALSAAGVPADVRTGTPCHSVPAPPGLDRVLSSGRDASTALVITPSAIPKGTVLAIGYRDPSSNGPMAVGLAWKDRMTC